MQYSGFSKAALGAAASLAVLAAVDASAAVVTSTGSAGFSVTNQSLFGPGNSAGDFEDSFDVGPNAASIYAEAQASTGSVSSSGNFNAALTYNNEQSLVDAANTTFTFGGGINGGFSTAFGASFEAGFDTNIPVVSALAPFTLFDLDYLLDANANGSGFDTAITGADSVAFAQVGLEPLPTGVFVQATASANAVQTSTLNFGGVSGDIIATNQTTGESVIQSFFFDGTSFDFDLDLSTLGMWDLSLDNLFVVSTFQSFFGLSVTATVGVGAGVSCGNLDSDSDNFLCTDEGTSITSRPLNLADIDPFALGYNQLDPISLGSVVVTPIPGALLLFLSGIGALGGASLNRRRQAMQTA